MGAGRKPIYSPETLKIGERMQLKGKPKKYSWQYIRSFNNRAKSKGLFKVVNEGKKTFIERVE